MSSSRRAGAIRHRGRASHADRRPAAYPLAHHRRGKSRSLPPQRRGRPGAARPHPPDRSRFHHCARPPILPRSTGSPVSCAMRWKVNSRRSRRPRCASCWSPGPFVSASCRTTRSRSPPCAPMPLATSGTIRRRSARHRFARTGARCSAYRRTGRSLPYPSLMSMRNAISRRPALSRAATTCCGTCSTRSIRTSSLPSPIIRSTAASSTAARSAN